MNHWERLTYLFVLGTGVFFCVKGPKSEDGETTHLTTKPAPPTKSAGNSQRAPGAGLPRAQRNIESGKTGTAAKGHWVSREMFDRLFSGGTGFPAESPLNLAGKISDSLADQASLTVEERKNAQASITKIVEALKDYEKKAFKIETDGNSGKFIEIPQWPGGKALKTAFRAGLTDAVGSERVCRRNDVISRNTHINQEWRNGRDVRIGCGWNRRLSITPTDR